MNKISMKNEQEENTNMDPDLGDKKGWSEPRTHWHFFIKMQQIILGRTVSNLQFAAMVRNSKLSSHLLRLRALSHSARRRRTRCSSTSSDARTRPTRPGMDLAHFPSLSSRFFYLSYSLWRTWPQGFSSIGSDRSVILSLSFHVLYLLSKFHICRQERVDGAEQVQVPVPPALYHPEQPGQGGLR